MAHIFICRSCKEKSLKAFQSLCPQEMNSKVRTDDDTANPILFRLCCHIMSTMLSTYFRSVKIWNHAYDFRPNCIPINWITVTIFVCFRLLRRQRILPQDSLKKKPWIGLTHLFQVRFPFALIEILKCCSLKKNNGKNGGRWDINWVFWVFPPVFPNQEKKILLATALGCVGFLCLVCDVYFLYFSPMYSVVYICIHCLS